MLRGRKHTSLLSFLLMGVYPPEKPSTLLGFMCETNDLLREPLGKYDSTPSLCSKFFQFSLFIIVSSTHSSQPTTEGNWFYLFWQWNEYYEINQLNKLDKGGEMGGKAKKQEKIERKGKKKLD